MTTLLYDNFVEIARNLNAVDLLSLCSTNKLYNGYCKRPNFYHDLILFKYNLDIANATYRDYRFVEELEAIELTLPSSRTMFNIFPDLNQRDKAYDEVIEKAQKILDSYVLAELKAYLNKDPVRYFTYPQDNLRFSPLYNNQINGTWFAAHSPEGAMLKFKDFYVDTKSFGDYFVLSAFYSHFNHLNFAINHPPLKDDVLLLHSKDNPSMKAYPRIIITAKLIETYRPYVDHDHDRSKLEQAYQALLLSSKTPTSAIDYHDPVGSRRKREEIGTFFEDVHKTALASLNGTGERFFVIKPEEFSYHYFKPEQRPFGAKPYKIPIKMTGLVIEAKSPEEALLKLVSLVPDLASDIVDYFLLKPSSISDYQGMLQNLVMTLGGKQVNPKFLVEIEQPMIV